LVFSDTIFYLFIVPFSLPPFFPFPLFSSFSIPLFFFFLHVHHLPFASRYLPGIPSQASTQNQPLRRNLCASVDGTSTGHVALASCPIQNDYPVQVPPQGPSFHLVFQGRCHQKQPRIHAWSALQRVRWTWHDVITWSLLRSVHIHTYIGTDVMKCHP
jgi:hypothetical protein